MVNIQLIVWAAKFSDGTYVAHRDSSNPKVPACTTLLNEAMLLDTKGEWEDFGWMFRMWNREGKPVCVRITYEELPEKNDGDDARSEH